MNTYSSMDTPFGKITLSAAEYYLLGIDLFNTQVGIEFQLSPITRQLSTELNDFFEQAHNTWSIPLMYAGTDFQQRVWQYLRAIPIGEIRTYSQVASALNTSARAVGNACRTNPFPIVVPCHRVVSKSGLGGFAGKRDGHEMAVKQWLLDHERK